MSQLVDLQTAACSELFRLFPSCMVVLERIASQSFVFTKKGKYAGTVTSAMWSPSAKASIALASLEAPLGKPGEEYDVEIYYQRELKWSRVMAPARVVKDNFWDPPRRRQTPPADF